MGAFPGALKQDGGGHDFLPSGVGLYDEGDDTFSVYLNRVRVRNLTETLARYASDCSVVVLTGEPCPPGVTPLIGDGGWIGGPEQVAALIALEAPVELAVFRKELTPEIVERLLPSTLLSHPAGALPEELDPVFAVSIPERSQAVLLSRDHSVLQEITGECLAAEMDLREQELSGGVIEELMVPLEAWQWREVRRCETRRFNSLEIATFDGEEEQRCLWVAPRRGGKWREGWSW